MSYLLDTCVISESVRPTPNKGVARFLQEQDPAGFFLSALTLGELWKGVSRLPGGRKRRELESWVGRDLLEEFQGRILPVDPDVARRWGELQTAGQERGEPLPVVDSLLAATALVSGLVVVTRNTRHFLHSGVSLANPWEG